MPESANTTAANASRDRRSDTSKGWNYQLGVYIDPSTPEEDQEEVIAHELSHWWLTLMGVLSAQQDMIIDQFMLCWRMLRAAIYRKTSQERGGFSGGVQDLIDTYSAVASPIDVLVRAAMICRVGLVIFDEHCNRVPVGAGLFEMKIEMERGHELWVVAAALSREWPVMIETTEHADVCAVAFLCRDQRWVVLVASPPLEEAAAMGWG